LKPEKAILRANIFFKLDHNYCTLFRKEDGPTPLGFVKEEIVETKEGDAEIGVTADPLNPESSKEESSLIKENETIKGKSDGKNDTPSPHAARTSPMIFVNCNLCAFHGTKKNVVSHKAMKHSEYGCYVCTFTSKSRLNLSKHSCSDHSNRGCICRQCLAGSSNKENRSSSSGLMATISHYSIKSTDVKTQDLAAEIEYGLFGYNEKAFICNQCFYRAKSKFGLMEHIQLVHKGQPCESKGLEKQFFCSDCSFVSVDPNEMTKHKARHALL